MHESFNDLQEVIITEEELSQITDKLAKQLNRDYSGRNPLFVALLKGSVFFFADLVKKIDINCELEFVRAGSYKGTSTTGKVNIDKSNYDNFVGRDIVIIEDIVDTGITLTNVIVKFLKEGAKSIKVCTLLDKPSRRQVELVPDYCGKVIPDLFVVGYGLDFNEKYRNLPYIGYLKQEIYL